MSKILAALIAGLFAASVFAADTVPAAPAAGATADTAASAPAKKATHKHHKKHEKREANRHRVRCRDGRYEEVKEHGKGKGPEVCKHHGGLAR